MGWLGRLFGREPKREFEGPTATEVFEQSLRNANAFMTGVGLQEVGILFDVDALGGGFYGHAAYKIVLGALDPQKLKGCFVFDGDPMAMSGNLYCICFQTSDPKQAEYIRGVIGELDAPGLLPRDRRFARPPVTAPNSLVSSGLIDASGNFCVPRQGMINETWADGTSWTIYQKL